MSNILDVTKRSDKNRDELRAQTREEVMKWFVQAHGNIEMVAEECETSDAYGRHVWWLEPAPDNADNVCVIEEPLGNSGWAIRIEIMPKKIRSYGGL